MKLLRSTVLAIVFTLLITSTVKAQETGVYYGDVVSFQWVEVIFKNFLSIILSLIGLGSLVMVVTGGFQMLTAGSNQEGVQKAHKTLTYGIGGVFIALLVWFILVIIAKFTGANILEFNLQLT